MDALSSSEALAGSTLVVAAVGAGNVGQLAADLLVSTLALPRLGALEDSHLMPCVGRAPYAHELGAAVALELYGQAGGLCVLQQRSAAAPGASRGTDHAVARICANLFFEYHRAVHKEYE